ncbi:hypothetical protein Hanom_Chr16g01523501 [Helianthus anomalus]
MVFCHPHSRMIPGYWFLLLPIKLPLCLITIPIVIPSSEKPLIPSATALCVCLSLAPPP